MWRRLTFFIFAFFLTLLIAPVLFAAKETYSWREEDYRRGYVSHVNRDDDEPGVPFMYVENPDAGARTLRDTIFDETLTKEFTLKYHDRFGRTEAETLYTRNNVLEYYIVQGKEYSQEEYFHEQQRFANYMFRRTLEYQLDTKGKNNPATRSVVAVKQKMTNMNIGLGKNVKVKAKYSISGNDARVEAKTPVVDANVQVQMDPSKLYPSKVQTTTMGVGRDLGDRYYLETFFTSETGVFSVVGRKQLTDYVSTNITVSPNYLHWDGGTRVRERLYLSGFSWVF